MTYSFDGTTLPFVSSAIIPLASRIPTADTPARAGGYTGVRKTAVRSATLIGTLKSESFDALHADWATLLSAHDVDTPRALVTREGWFYYATPESLTESDIEATNLHYQADYKLSDPFSYSTTVNTESLVVGSTQGITAGGTRPALPTLTVVVSAAPAGGQIYIHNVTTDEACYLYPTITGTYVINSRTESFPQGGFDAFAGQFLSLAVGSNPISVLTSSGATVSSASISWRNRSL